MENKENLIKGSASITADPTTGMRSVVKPTEDYNMAEILESCTKKGISPVEAMLGGMGIDMDDVDSARGDILKLNRLIIEMKNGTRTKVKFKDLPEYIQDEATRMIGNNPQLLQSFTNEFIAEQVKEFENTTANQTYTMEDVDTGEKKNYSTMLDEQDELFESYRDNADATELYDMYFDAVHFNTLYDISCIKIPKYNKKMKHIKRLLRDYYFLYDAGRTTLTTLDAAHIPAILERHMKLNNSEYPIEAYEAFLLIYLNHVVYSNLSTKDILGHVYMHITTKTIFDLDYLKVDDEQYTNRIADLKRVLDNLVKIYL